MKESDDWKRFQDTCEHKFKATCRNEKNRSRSSSMACCSSVYCPLQYIVRKLEEESDRIEIKGW